jgi:hypothetical protein
MIFDKATITLPDDTVTGDINTFNNLRNGIIAYDCSSFEIGKQTTKFSNIIGNSIMNSQSTLVDGCGIFAGSHDGTPCLGTFIKRGNESLTIPDFDNCSHAIYSRGYKTKLLSNRINNVHTGIQIEKAMDLETDIHDNIINCSQKGIFLYQNSPNVFSISNNFIHLINNANNSSQVSACIEVSEFVNSSQSTNGNIIFANKVYAENYANFGILCNTTKGTKIFENEAYLTDATYNKAGIKTELGENLVINCNQIYGPGASLGGSIYPTGIEAQTSPNSEYSCNYMTDTYTGFYLDGGCYQSDIRGNTFGSHSIGLHYGADGNSGYQYDKGNIWLTQCSLYGAKHDNQGTYWMYSRYTANQYTQYWPNGTTLFDPPGWFLNSSNTPFSCEDLDPPCSDKDGMRTYSPAIDTLVSAYDTATAQMQLPANIFNDEITWSASKTLYQKLREQPELLSGNQVMGSFIDSIQYESPASYQEIDDLGQSVLQMPEALSATFNNLLEQRSVLVDSIQLIDSLLSLLPSYSDSLDMIALKTNILTNLKMINNQIVSVQNAHAQIRNNSATELLAGNSALNVENDITANTKLLNEIYFSTFGKGIYTFTDTQLQLLKTIAIQCPVSGGPSVYGARSLLSGCYDTTYDDSDICLQAGILKSLQNPVMVNEQIQYNFYPNPASENLTITWNIPLDEQAELNLYNTTGQRIFTQRILLKNTAVNIDISGMSSGIYSIELVRQSVVRKMGKLVCISSK